MDVVSDARLWFISKIININIVNKPKLLTILVHGVCKSCPECTDCGESLGHIRADDFLPYLTMVIVGHIIVPLLLLSEQYYAPPTWFQMTVWPIAALALMGVMLPICKGFCVNLIWHLGLTGEER
jgi:uncharacterized protein (DUF983 family)